MRKDKYIEQRSCAPAKNHHWGLWTLMAILGGLYWLGKRQRPTERQPAVEETDELEVSETWQHVSRLPPFRFMRKYMVRRALIGHESIRVLDVGCGAGELAIMLARHPNVIRMVGIDLSNELIKQARESAEEQGVNAEFLNVDGSEMPFSDDSFDLVISTVSLHHWKDPQQVLQEINRVLAPDGRALIFDLRRDASPIFWGVAKLVTRYIVPQRVRDIEEPLASFKASYTPAEALLMAFKSGWKYMRVKKGPIWMALELQKGPAA